MWIFFVKTDPSCLQHCFQNSIEWYSMSKLLNRRLSCLFSSRIQFLSNDNFPPFSRKLLSLNELPPNLRMRTLSRWVSTTQGPFWLRCESCKIGKAFLPKTLQRVYVQFVDLENCERMKHPFEIYLTQLLFFVSSIGWKKQKYFIIFLILL